MLIQLEYELVPDPLAGIKIFYETSTAININNYLLTIYFVKYKTLS